MSVAKMGDAPLGNENIGVSRIDSAQVWTNFVHMRTVTVRDLRNNFSRLEIWLGEGEEIQIEKQGQPVALLTGLPKGRRKRIRKPDFTARLKRLWGDRIFSLEEVRAMRAAELQGEEG